VDGMRGMVEPELVAYLRADDREWATSPHSHEVNKLRLRGPCFEAMSRGTVFVVNQPLRQAALKAPCRVSFLWTYSAMTTQEASN